MALNFAKLPDLLHRSLLINEPLSRFGVCQAGPWPDTPPFL